jgi:hypothetical protein
MAGIPLSLDSRTVPCLSYQQKVKVTLRLTVSQSVSLGVEPQILLFDIYGLVFVGRPL